MIKINFDKYGKIRNLDFGDEVIFKGNNRVNQIFVSFDDVSYNPNHYMTYSALINENDYEGDLTDLATAKTTIDGVEGYTFYLFSNLTAKAGELKLSVRLVDRTTERVLVSGVVSLVVEDTAISTYASVDITKTQYNALLTAFDELSQSIDATNFKTINGESIYGEGDIVVLTGDVMVNYVGYQISNVNNSLHDLYVYITELQDENAELNALIEKQEKKIKQLELASEGNILSTITESDSAYEVDVGVDTLPNVSIDKIGGMTYKSENLLAFDDVAETTTNGITYRVENGVFYYSGNATARVDINVNLKNKITLNEAYRFAMFNQLVNTTVMRLSSGGSVFRSIRLSTANISNTYTDQNQLLDALSFMIESGTSVTNASVSPMLLFGTTAPTTYQPYFEGLRDSKVTEIISAGANLLPRNWNSVNDTIELNKPLKANEKYTMCIYVTTNVADGKGVNIYDEKDNLLFNNSMANWGQPSDGWNSFVFTPTIDTKTLRINAYGIVSKEMKCAILKGALVTEKKYNSINLFKPYHEPTAIEIPTAIQNLDGYGLGVNETYYNYVDFENKKFVKMVQSITINGSEETQWVNSADYGNNLRIRISNDNVYYNVDAVTYLNDKMQGVTFNNRTINTSIMRFYISQLEGKIWIECRDTKDNAIFTNQQTALQWVLNNCPKFVYTLATPVAEGLSHIIDGEILTEVESGGTLTFENEYKQDVPFTWTFQEKL